MQSPHSPKTSRNLAQPTSWVTMTLLGMTSFHGALGGTLGPPLHKKVSSEEAATFTPSKTFESSAFHS